MYGRYLRRDGGDEHQGSSHDEAPHSQEPLTAKKRQGLLGSRTSAKPVRMQALLPELRDILERGEQERRSHDGHSSNLASQRPHQPTVKTNNTIPETVGATRLESKPYSMAGLLARSVKSDECPPKILITGATPVKESLIGNVDKENLFTPLKSVKVSSASTPASSRGPLCFLPVEQQTRELSASGDSQQPALKAPLIIEDSQRNPPHTADQDIKKSLTMGKLSPPDVSNVPHPVKTPLQTQPQKQFISHTAHRESKTRVGMDFRTPQNKVMSRDGRFRLYGITDEKLPLHPQVAASQQHRQQLLDQQLSGVHMSSAHQFISSLVPKSEPAPSSLKLSPRSSGSTARSVSPLPLPSNKPPEESLEHRLRLYSVMDEPPQVAASQEQRQQLLDQQLSGVHMSSAHQFISSLVPKSEPAPSSLKLSPRSSGSTARSVSPLPLPSNKPPEESLEHRLRLYSVMDEPPQVAASQEQRQQLLDQQQSGLHTSSAHQVITPIVPKSESATTSLKLSPPSSVSVTQSVSPPPLPSNKPPEESLEHRLRLYSVMDEPPQVAASQQQKQPSVPHTSNPHQVSGPPLSFTEPAPPTLPMYVPSSVSATRPVSPGGMKRKISLPPDQLQVTSETDSTRAVSSDKVSPSEMKTCHSGHTRKSAKHSENISSSVSQSLCASTPHSCVPQQTEAAVLKLMTLNCLPSSDGMKMPPPAEPLSKPVVAVAEVSDHIDGMVKKLTAQSGLPASDDMKTRPQAEPLSKPVVTVAEVPDQMNGMGKKVATQNSLPSSDGMKMPPPSKPLVKPVVTVAEVPDQMNGMGKKVTTQNSLPPSDGMKMPPPSKPLVKPDVTVAEVPHQINGIGKKSSRMDELVINEKSYAVLSLLGRGGSSMVYQVLDPSTSQLLAVKCVNLTEVDQSIYDGYLNEIQLLGQLQDGDCVVRMFDYEHRRQNRMLYVVMEKGDTDLSKLIKDLCRTKKISAAMIVYYWTEMLNAVSFIHKRGTIHSDLKPANFLLVSGRLKLIDFGIASSVQGDQTSVIKDSMTGTYNYISPEALSCTGGSDGGGQKFKITYKSDVWSLGCILYNLVYGHTPFQAITNSFQKMTAIVSDSYKIPFPTPPIAGCPPTLIDAMQACLVRDPKLRPTVDELRRMPYLGQGGPEKRILAHIASLAVSVNVSSETSNSNHSASSVLQSIQRVIIENSKYIPLVLKK